MKRLIMAPLRGFTDAVFRNAFLVHFQGISEAVAPFVTSTKGRRIKPSHLRDLAPEENSSLPIVPQILSNHAGEFVRLANTLSDMGYDEINWNLGCPYPMVAKKKRGSGLLAFPDLIDRLLDEIMHTCNSRISIKTRLGRFSKQEMESWIAVINRYPIVRVIVHPRTGVQMYTGSVDLDAFAACLAEINHPVVYNGDITDVDTFLMLETRFPAVGAWMLGRGLVGNPFLAEMIQSGKHAAPDTKERFIDFHEDLLAGYLARFSGPGHVLDRMKGLWRYFALGFDDGRRILKQVRKTRSLERYRQLVGKIWEDL